jgi:hypothetical protein
MTLDDIHKQIHIDHEVLSVEDFAQIKKFCAFLMVSYINSVLLEPDNKNLHARKYNAILNKADEIAEVLKNERKGLEFVEQSENMSEWEIYLLGSQPVRAVDTGCGFSGGAEVASALGSYSVAQFGYEWYGDRMTDSKGSRVFACPEIGCGKMNIRPHEGFLERCQHCFSDKVACKDDSKIRSLDKYRQDRESKSGDQKKSA